MKRKIVSIVCFLIFIFPSFVLAEVVSDSASTATASLVYNPESYYTSSTNRRDLIGVNSYAGFVSPIPVSLLKDYEDFTEPDVLKTLNKIDWKLYKPRSKNPFKKVREILSYLAGKSDYINPTITFIVGGEKKPKNINRDIVFLTKNQAAQYTAAGFSKDRSLEAELPYLSLFDAVYPLMTKSDLTRMCVLKRSVDQGVAEGDANTISMAISKAIAKSGNDDAEQFSMGATGTSGKTVSRREILPDFLILAYPEIPIQTETEVKELKATYVFAPILFDFEEFNIRSDQVEGIKKIAEAVKQVLLSSSKKVYFVGNCDVRGLEGYNDTLGMNRGSASRSTIAAILSEQGIDKSILENRLLYASAGKRQRVFKGNDEASHQRNRRVDVIAAEDITSLEALPLPELTNG